MNRCPNPSKPLLFQPLLWRWGRLREKFMNLQAVCAAVMLAMVCSSCASNSEFSNSNKGTSPAMETPSTNLLVKTVETYEETNEEANVEIKVAETNRVAASAVNSGSTNAMDALDDKYKLEIGDTVNFQVLEDQGDPQKLNVTDSGDLQVPCIGPFPAAGKTCKELARQLKVELEKKYYYKATVVVSVNSMTSQGVIYLVGGVMKPGPMEIPRDDVLTVSKAILRAGGFDDFADEKHVQVTRSANGTNEVLTVNVSAILDKNQFQKDIKAEPGDFIYVPEKTFRF